MAMNVVRVTNTGDTPFIDKFDGQKFRVEPHSDTLVPFDAICLWMGNPGARDIDAKRRDRTDEFGRLRVRYGVYEHEHLWETARPHLEVTTLEGERILTVAEDPEGRAVQVEFAREADTNEALRADLADVRSTLDKVLAALAQAGPETAQAVMQAIAPDHGPDVILSGDTSDDDLGGPLEGIDVTTTTVTATPAPDTTSGVTPDPQDAALPEDNPTRVKVGTRTTGSTPQPKAPGSTQRGTARVKG